MSNNSYAKPLTKELLINNFNIVDVTRDGKVFVKDSKKNKIKEVNLKPKYGSNKYYGFCTYDHVNLEKVPCKVKRTNKQGEVRIYDGYCYRAVTLLLHRLMYV